MREKLETKKNLQMIGATLEKRQGNFNEYITNKNETLIGNDLLSVLNIKNDLTKYVKTVSVEKLSGQYPYLKYDNAELQEVADLEQSGNVQDVEIINIDYEVKTYRFILPISLELFQDVKDSQLYDISETVAGKAKQIDINTKNRIILNKFKLATPKAVTGINGLTTLINKDIKSIYDIKLFISSSLYDLLDQAGKIEYIEPYPTFKGKEVVKVDDTKLGLEGDLVGFVGDAKEYLHLFDRNYVTIKDNRDRDFSRPILVATRFDIVPS